MRTRNSLVLVCLATLVLTLTTLHAQEATDETLNKAREVLRATDPDAAPGSQAGQSPEDVQKQANLRALLQKYRAGEMSAGQYHRERSKIVGVVTPINKHIPKPDPAAIAAAEAAAAAAAKPSFGDPKHLEAAVVPGADLILRLDLRGMRETPIYNTLQKLSEEKTKENDDPTSPVDYKNVQKIIDEKLGLKEEDLGGWVLSMDLDELGSALGGTATDTDPDPDSDAAQAVRGVLAIQSAKPLTTSKLKEVAVAISKINDESAEVELVEEKIGEFDVLGLPPGPEMKLQPYLTVVEAKTVLIGFNRASLSEALDRATTEPAPLDKSLDNVMKSISSDAQMKLSFVVPDSIAEAMLDQSAAADPPAASGEAGAPDNAPPAGGMGMGMLGEMLGDIRSVSLGMKLDEKLALTISGDLGNAEAVNGLNMAVQMLKPQLFKGMAESIGQSPVELAKLLTSTVNGDVLTLNLSLSNELLEALNEAKK